MRVELWHRQFGGSWCNRWELWDLGTINIINFSLTLVQDFSSDHSPFWMKHHCRIHPASPRTSLLAASYPTLHVGVVNDFLSYGLHAFNGHSRQFPPVAQSGCWWTWSTQSWHSQNYHLWDTTGLIKIPSQRKINFIHTSFEVYLRSVTSMGWNPRGIWRIDEDFAKNQASLGDVTALPVAWWCLGGSLDAASFDEFFLRSGEGLEPWSRFFFLAGRTWSDGKKETLDTKNEMILNVCHFGYVCPIFFTIMLKPGRISMTHRLKDNGCLLSFTQKKSCPMKLSGPRKRDGVVVLEALSDAKTVRTAFQELNF